VLASTTAFTASAPTFGLLTFAVTSGQAYKFSFRIPWRTGASAIGMRAGLIFPAAIMAVASVRIAHGPDGAAGTTDMVGLITSSGDSVVSPSAPTSNVDLYCHIEGDAVFSGAGNLGAFVAAEATSTGSGLSVRTGSNGIIWNMGAAS
jgi:hypothetical protein